MTVNINLAVKASVKVSLESFELTEKDVLFVYGSEFRQDRGCGNNQIDTYGICDTLEEVAYKMEMAIRRDLLGANNEGEGMLLWVGILPSSMESYRAHADAWKELEDYGFYDAEAETDEELKILACEAQIYGVGREDFVETDER